MLLDLATSVPLPFLLLLTAMHTMAVNPVRTNATRAAASVAATMDNSSPPPPLPLSREAPPDVGRLEASTAEMDDTEGALNTEEECK